MADLELKHDKIEIFIMGPSIEIRVSIYAENADINKEREREGEILVLVRLT